MQELEKPEPIKYSKARLLSSCKEGSLGGAGTHQNGSIDFVPICFNLGIRY